MSKFAANRLFTLNNPAAPRLCPELAAEIGLNESIILLQIEFWVAISNNVRDGRRWTYQSVRDIQESFPFWSPMTINRAIHSLEDKGLIISANYNQLKYDYTRWFSLNEEEIGKLNSVKLANHVVPLYQNDTGLYQNDTRSNHFDTRSNQNDTTIPDSSSENTAENTAEKLNNNSAGKSEKIAQPAEDQAWQKWVEYHPMSVQKADSDVLAANCKEYPAEWVLQAIERGYKYKDKPWLTWGFVEGILKNWQRLGGDKPWEHDLRKETGAPAKPRPRNVAPINTPAKKQSDGTYSRPR